MGQTSQQAGADNVLDRNEPVATGSDQGALVVEEAPAKINLALHVVGRRADGYHLLESLVAFADCGDRLAFARSEADRLVIDGPFAGALGADDGAQSNLVMRALSALRAALPATHRAATFPVTIRLTKRLPVASGIGGGSADAAAALRGLMRLWAIPEHAVDLAATGLSLGADVPMCLAGQPLAARGIGERIERLPAFPALPIVLANPGVAVATLSVFAALAHRQNPPLVLPEAFDDATALVSALAGMRNDLETPARTIAPEIGAALAALAETGAALVRMSGSGATCFGLYRSAAEAERAGARLRSAHPGWFVAAGATMAAKPAEQGQEE